MNRNANRQAPVLWLLMLLLVACGAPQEKSTSSAQDSAVSGPVSFLDREEETYPNTLQRVGDPWQGDFDGMVERRYLRALVPVNRTNYFVDGGQQRGATYEGLKAFEEKINGDLGTGHLKVHIVIIPTARDRLLPGLLEGYGDIAAGTLTITPERRELVDFSAPSLTGVSEIVVTGPTGPASLDSLDDLAGQEVTVRRSSSYWESLVALDKSFVEAGRPQMLATAAHEALETEDILEMVNSGMIPITVADDYLAEFWSQVYDNITLHPELSVRTGGEIGWAIRKDSPKLKAVINDFVSTHKKGTLRGNMLFTRYMKDTRWAENPLGGESVEKLRQMREFFQTYGDRYELDWLLLAAQGFQESRLDQSVRSSAGAVGVMQLLPTTAADRNVGIDHIESSVENNIHAGTKYLRFIIDRYFSDPDINRTDQHLLALAAYNAGPARVAGLRRQAEAAGLDPNRWFKNVEVIAAKEIGRETVQYVSNILKYSLAYQQIVRRIEERDEAR